MIQRSAALIALPLLLVTFVAAQAGRGSLDAGPPPVKIIFDKSIPYDSVWIAYGVFSPHGGGHTSFDMPKPSRPYYEVWAALGDRVRILVWAPGCMTKEFDLQFGGANGELEFTCDTLKNVTLAGRVRQVDMGGKSATISVAYDAQWPCFFLTYCKERFCQVSCAWQGIPIGTARVESDGTFKFELPDFSADPIAADGAFSFFIHTGKRTVSLESLRTAPSYPGDLTLVPRK